LHRLPAGDHRRDAHEVVLTARVDRAHRHRRQAQRHGRALVGSHAQGLEERLGDAHDGQQRGDHRAQHEARARPGDQSCAQHSPGGR
jgi:hypothetical protein